MAEPGGAGDLLPPLAHRYKGRCRKPVTPGDQVKIHVNFAQRCPPVWKYTAEALVDGKKVAEAEIGAMLMDSK